MSKVRSWWERRPPGIGAVILLCVGAFLVVCATEWIAMGHHRTVTQSEAVTGEDFPGDFTKNPDPPEPQLPPAKDFKEPLF